MWDMPNYRVKTYLRNMRSQQNRERLKSIRQRLHLRRAKALIRINDGLATATDTIHARVILNELQATGIRIYSSSQLRPGQEISITIEEPRYFYARALVTWVDDVGHDRKILTQNPLNYRVGLRFITRNQAEERAIAAYVNELQTTLIHQPAGI